MLNLIKKGWTQTSAPEKSATQDTVVSTFNLPESNPKRLSDKHYNHCCGSDTHQKQRGLDPDWIAANCYSVDIKEATELLGYPARSGGIIISGSNGQYQFRPDKPWSDKQGKKAAKYRTAFKDEYDALLPAHPSDPYFWHDKDALKARCWLIDGHPYIIITEGGFKAICACFHGLPTAALLGVEMGLTSAKADPQGKRYLVAALERLAKAGFGFILAFDTDLTTNLDVRKALHKLGSQLTKFNVPVYVLPSWDEQLGKGIDDYISMNGIEEFRQQLLAKAICFVNWQDEYEDGRPSIPEGYPTSWEQFPLAKWLVKRYENRLAWDVSLQEWRTYSTAIEGIWSIEPVEFVRQVILAELKANQSMYTITKDDKVREPRITDSLVRNIEALMRYELAVRTWDETEEFIPFTNGVLSRKTLLLMPHDPEHRLTWCLPYDYNPLALCDPILQWLKEMCFGDENLVQLLRAYLHGIVTGRTDWQKYLELVGPGGTGKSTYLRLAISLVGMRNVHTTTLKKLENERFETASIKDKRLVVITDSERYTGNVSILKALTGQDPLPYEVKFKQSHGGFTPTAMVLVAANEIIQSGDYTSGLERRRLSVPMTHRIETTQQKNLIEHRNGEICGEFAPYIPGLLNWVLGMKPDEATALIKNYQQRVPKLAQMKAQSLVETNPIADWLDHALVYRDGYRMAVGVAKRDKNLDSENWYCHVNQWLYANYAEYCQNTGAKAISVRRFVNLLSDLCVNQLKLDVTHGRDRYGAYFLGLKIRTDADLDPLLITGDHAPPASPPPFLGGQSPPKSSLGVTDVMDGVMDSVMAQTLTGDGCDGCDGLFQNSFKEKNQLHSSVTDVGLNKAINNGSLSSHPSHQIAQTIKGDELKAMRVPSQPSSQNHHGDGTNPSQKSQANNSAPRSYAQTQNGDGNEPIQPPKIDYSTYPHRNSNDIRAKEKRANKCSEGMLVCNNKEELTRFKNESGFSSNEIDWVFFNVLTPSQQQKFNEAASADQLNLLKPVIYQYNEVMKDIDHDLIRLGWSVEQAKEYLFQTYGVKSRRFLDDDQIIELWQYLKRQ
ncbi:ATPase [Aphanothece hegewaldii CCALA 016]|uniref:ATPase n=1 Tax=Aphanothece hegewaldii CCALA 016 TaxID=2107694 RepID=A0A2T1LR69_9CHRO|nr:phage/plasmid primase, P4 family [Aphanothece hegewaldii]PSF30994.1 ATPase [Aphanothece hegewaldii CCALA 016]